MTFAPSGGAWLFAATTALTVIGLIGLALGLRRGRASEPVQAENFLGRIRQHLDTDETESDAKATRLTPRKQLENFIARRNAANQQGNLEAKARELVLADIPFRPEEFLIIRILLGVGVAGLASLRVGLIVGGLMGLIVGSIGINALLAFRRRRRESTFERQLVDVITIMSSGLKAGHSFTQTLGRISEEIPAPAGLEFGRLGMEMDFGIPLGVGLKHLAERNASRELRLLVVALEVNHKAGGNLASILDSLQATLRERIRLRGDVRALTAQARFSGWIAACLPLALVAILSAISPSYLDPMFHNPLGLGLLAVAGSSVAIGVGLMRKMGSVKL